MKGKLGPALLVITLVFNLISASAAAAGWFGTSEKEYCKRVIMNFIKMNDMSAELAKGGGRNTPDKERLAEKMQALIRNSIDDSTKVSDQFLDGIHPQLRVQFRQNLIRGGNLYLEGLETSDVSTQIKGLQRLEAWDNFRRANLNLLYDRIVK